MGCRSAAFIISLMIHMGLLFHYPFIHSGSTAILLPVGHANIEVLITEQKKNQNIKNVSTYYLNTNFIASTIERVTETFDRFKDHLKEAINDTFQKHKSNAQAGRIDPPESVQKDHHVTTPADVYPPILQDD
ncbi:MAG: hypothetical protein Q8Q33_01440 [Chlamydiota bacterium]|nr:hypothetical protein [Chlamydiota bacterium]